MYLEFCKVLKVIQTIGPLPSIWIIREWFTIMVTLASLLNPLFTRATVNLVFQRANPRTVHRTPGSTRILFPSCLVPCVSRRAPWYLFLRRHSYAAAVSLFDKVENNFQRSFFCPRSEISSFICLSIFLSKLQRFVLTQRRDDIFCLFVAINLIIFGILIVPQSK